MHRAEQVEGLHTQVHEIMYQSVEGGEYLTVRTREANTSEEKMLSDLAETRYIAFVTENWQTKNGL